MRPLLFAAILALPTVAHAQDAADTPVTLPERVVTATRVPSLIDTTAAGVTVIDRGMIETRGYTTLVEALGAVPGLSVVQSGGPGGNASVFVRGTNSNQVLVLRDGVPLNDPSDPTGAYNFGVDTLADVERIEVVRGPMSGVWGSGAIGGVINLITRKGSGTPTGTVSVGAGLPLALDTEATVSGATGPVDYAATVESRSDDGSDFTPQRESVYNGRLNGYRSQLATLNLGVNPTDTVRLYGFLRYRTSVFGLDELGSPAYDATDYTGRDESFTGRVGVQATLFDIWDTGLSVGHISSLRRYDQALEPDNPNQSFGTSRYNGDRTALAWTNTVHLADWGPATGSALTFGAAQDRDSAKSELDTSSFGTPYLAGVKADARYTSGDAGLQTVLAQRLTVSGHIREENATYGGSAFTWRIGGVLAVPEAWSRLKASYGTSFLAPSLFQLFGVDSFGFVGNPNLQPERSQGWEAGWAVDLPALGRSDAATIEVTYFNNRIENLIQLVYSPDFLSSTEQNIASARTNGVEAGITLRAGAWGDAVVSYTYTNAVDQTGAPLLRRPRNQASASIRFTPRPGLVIAPEIIYRSGATDFLVGNDGFPGPVGLTQAGVIFNLTVTYAATPQLTLFAKLRNLSSSPYEPASGYQIPGPSGLVGAQVTF